MLRVAVLAALAVCSQAGYLAGLPHEGSAKNKIVKVVQFPKISLVSDLGCARLLTQRAPDTRSYTVPQTGTDGVNPFLSDSDWSTPTAAWPSCPNLLAVPCFCAP